MIRPIHFTFRRLLKFEEAKGLHVEQSTLAATAFLERNPKGFDNDDLLKQMFLKQAFQKASAYQAAEEPEFKSKQLHQKVEISGINILNTREDFVLTQVTGQLIRDGVFEDKPFTEAIPVQAVAPVATQSQHGAERQIPDGRK